MSWLTDLAHALGIPITGLAIAVSLSYALQAAEKGARPEALTDIANFLKGPLKADSLFAGSAILYSFRRTFGERHLSWLCLRRSVVATVLFLTFFPLSGTRRALICSTTFLSL